MTNFDPHYVSVPAGARPFQTVPGQVYNLTPGQHDALAAHPLLYATNVLVWRVLAGRSTLNQDGCRLMARVLGAASRGLEQIRAASHTVAVDVQLLLARVSLVTRELSIDLRFAARNSLGPFGALSVSLPQAQIDDLAQLENIDPLTTPVALQAAAFADIQSIVVPIIDSLKFT